MCHLPLFFGEPLGVLWPIGEEEECDDADEDTSRSFDDEEPLPADLDLVSSSLVDGWIRSVSHLYRPAIPPMVCKIPAAKNPDTMFEIVFPACQTAMRIGLSCFVYQEDVTIMC